VNEGPEGLQTADCECPVFQLGVCGMDFLISDGSERFLTNVGRFGPEFGSVLNPKKPRFCSENLENIVLNLRKPTYKYKLALMHAVL
jgi:hypothetical protein